MQRSLTLFLAVFAFAAMTHTAAAAEARPLKVSVLCDDTVSSDEFVTEHGVSLLVELRNGHRWLVDTGTTDVFLENAKRMGYLVGFSADVAGNPARGIVSPGDRAEPAGFGTPQLGEAFMTEV